MTAFSIDLLHKVIHLPKFKEIISPEGDFTSCGLEAVVRELPEFKTADGQQKAGDVSKAFFDAIQGLKAGDVNNIVDSIYGLVQEGMLSADEITEELIIKFTSNDFSNIYRKRALQGVENLKTTNKKDFDSLISEKINIMQHSEGLSYAKSFIGSTILIKRYFPEIQKINDPIERLGLYEATLIEIDKFIHNGYNPSATRAEQTQKVIPETPVPEPENNGSHAPLIAGLIGLVTTLGGFIFSKEKVKNVFAAIGAFLAAATATAAIKGDGKMSNGFLDGKGALAVGGSSLALLAIPFLLFENKVKESFTSVGAAVLGGILSYKFEFVRGLVGLPVNETQPQEQE